MSKIQRQGVKTDTQIVAGGGLISDLINDNQIYVSANSLNKTLKNAIIDGDIGGGSVSMSSQTSLSNGGTITQDNKVFQNIRVGASSEITLSTTPFGTTAPIKDGTTVTLIGTNDINLVNITTSDIAKGFILNGDVSLGKYKSITVRYVSADDRYIEISRNF